MGIITVLSPVNLEELYRKHYSELVNNQRGSTAGATKSKDQKKNNSNK